MMSRFVMVVLVAGLGVTLPSEPECRSVIGSLQHWANERVATAFSWSPTADGGSLGEHRQPRPRLFVARRMAREAAQVGEFVGPRVATVLRSRRVANDLTRAEAGPVILPRILITTGLLERMGQAQVVATSQPAKPTTPVEHPSWPVGMESFDSVPPLGEGAMPALAWELERMREQVAAVRAEPTQLAPSTPMASTLPSPSSNADLKDMGDVDDWDYGTVASPVVVSVPVQSEPDFEPIELCGEVAWDLDDQPAAEPLVIASASADRTPSWTPMEIPDTLDQGVAYDLNRASEGLPTQAWPTSSARGGLVKQAETTPAGPKGLETVGHAVELTRAALGAWLGVLKSTEVRVVTIR